MRILFLNYEYPPLGGGAANATFYLLREFAKMPDLEIELATSSVDGNYHLEKVGNNIKIHHLPIGKNPKNLHYQTQKDLLVYSWKAYFFSRKLVKENKFDLTLAFFGIPCGFLAMLLGLPYVVSLRGSDVPFYNERFKILDNLFFRWLSLLIWKKARAVAANSHDLAELAKQTSRTQKINIIYNGINMEEFKPVPEVLAREKTFNVLFVGRLIERKGLIYLLEAVKNLAPEYPQIRLLVVSDGPLMDEYQKYASENNIGEVVKFFGKIDHGEVAKVFQKSHVFVLPSLSEALANVTQEALASGLPIITTKTGAAEMIEGNGLIIGKMSSREIEEALEKLMADENLRLAMAQKSRQIAEKYSWGRTAEEYMKIFGEIM